MVYDAYVNADMPPVVGVVAPAGGYVGTPVEEVVRRHKPFEAGFDSREASAKTDIRPSEGGVTRPPYVFGWRTGLRPRGEQRAPLTGMVVVIPNNIARDPRGGPVGLDSHTSNLDGRTKALVADYLPSYAQLAASFTGNKAFAAEVSRQMEA